MAQISYTNKVALNENPEILDINKVTDDDMNEIKQVVNDNYNNTIQITDTEPTDPDNKLWIDTGEIQNSGSEIESGSNENGNWIKFADGTMVCYGNVSLTIPIATAISPIGGYRNTGGTNTKVFPQPFYEIPIVNTQVVLYTATQSYAHNITTSGFDLFFTTISSDNTNTERKASYIAIGRWKA